MALTVSQTALYFGFSFLAFLFAISVHESAHALVADRCGDPTARLAGRISLNPLRHIELFGTIILPILGALGGFAMFGWARPTPVDPTKLRNPRRDDILISTAGPASNLLTAVCCVLALFVIRLASSEGAQIVDRLATTGAPGSDGSALIPIAWLLHRLVVISVVLGIFNLFPVPPLDGSHILHQLLPQPVRAWYRAGARYGFLVLLFVLWYTPVGRWTFIPAMNLVNSLLRQ
jgi:Zn-dependent protease